jgi:hypothetical protein
MILDGLILLGDEWVSKVITITSIWSKILIEVFYPYGRADQVKVGGRSNGKPDHIIRIHYYVNLKEKA